MHIFELLCAIEITLVSSHSLDCQLSFFILLYMFIVYITGDSMLSEAFFTFRGYIGINFYVMPN